MCGKANSLVRIEPVEKIPVFCMFAVYERDCKEDDAGRIVIILSEDKKQTIREHFPNADAVAIIPNPEVFIEDIRHSIGTEVKAENVHYFHIDKEAILYFVYLPAVDGIRKAYGLHSTLL